MKNYEFLYQKIFFFILIGVFFPNVTNGNEFLGIYPFEKTNQKQQEGYKRILSKKEIISTLNRVKWKPRPNFDRSFPRLPGFYNFQEGGSLNLILFTDILVHSEDTPKSLIIWVTRMSDGHPISGADINVIDCSGQSLATGKTNIDGVVEIKKFNLNQVCKKKSTSEYYIFAETEGDISVCGSKWNKGYETWRYTVPVGNVENEKNNKYVKVHTILPRSNFNPGERVYMKHYIGSIGQLPNQLIVNDQWGNEFLKTPIQFTKKSTNSQILLPLSIPLGNYDIFYKFPDNHLEKSRSSFTVYKYNPPQANIVWNILGSDTITIQLKDLSKFSIQGLLNTGEPAVGLRMEVTFQFLSSQTQIQNILPPGFVFYSKKINDDCTELINGRKITSQTLKLNNKGEAIIEIPPLILCNQPKVLLVQLDYKDPNGQYYKLAKHIKVLPGDRAIGLKWSENNNSNVMGVITDSRGAPQPNVTFEIELYKNVNFIHRKKLVGGNFSYDFQTTTNKIRNLCSGRSNNLGIFECEMRDLSSEFLIIQAHIGDSLNGHSYSSLSLDNRPQNQRFTKIQGGKQLRIWPTKTEFDISENIALQVETPFRKSSALVIVQYGKNQDYFRFELKKDSPRILFPSKQEYFPNAVVSVLLVRGNVVGEKEKFTKSLQYPTARFGATEITFKKKSDPLILSLDANKKEFDGNNEIEINLSVKNNDATTEALLFAVDEREISFLENNSFFIGDKLFPDSKLKMNVNTGANFLGEAAVEAGTRPMITGALWGARPYYNSSSFKKDPVALWIPNLVLKKGTATIKFKPAPNDAGYVVVAVARSNSGYGTTALLQLKPNLSADKMKSLTQKGKDSNVSEQSKKSSRYTQFREFKILDAIPKNEKPTQEDLEYKFEVVRDSYIPSDKAVLDRSNYILGHIRTQFEQRSLPWLDIESVSPKFIEMLLKAEDQDFFSHGGVSWFSMARAGVRNIIHGEHQGASTLTMQLVGLIDQRFKGRKKSIGDKLKQIDKARNLEKTWTKNQILEAYINLVPLRGEYIGLNSISWGYFNKEANFLNEMESALITALIRSPNSTPTLVAKRACKLLVKNNCSQVETYTKEVFRNAYLDNGSASVQHIIRDDLLIEKNKSYFKTTLDVFIQNVAKIFLNKHLLKFNNQNLKDGAVLIIENKTGNILAYVSSTGKEISETPFVDHIQAERQPGSVIKPFIYAAAFDLGLMNINTLIEDAPISIPTINGETYSPHNATYQHFGWVTAGDALGSSLNIPAVKTFQLATEKEAVKKLRQFGLKNVVENSGYGPTISLGAVPMSMWDLVHAYHLLSKGKGLRKSTQEQLQLMLSSPMFRHLTFGTDSPLTLPFKVAVKTGSSTNNRDSWSMGWNSEFTVGVWTGNSSGSVPWAVGNNNALYLWRDLMIELEKYFPSKDLSIDLEKYEKHQEKKIPDEIYFTYPRSNMTFAIDIELPLEAQKIPLKLSRLNKSIKLVMDGVVIERGVLSTDYFWQLTIGNHTLEVQSPSGEVYDKVNFNVE